MQFKDIPGNLSTKQQLIEQVAHNRVPHAQLFYGREGSSALPTALAMAQFLNCNSRISNGNGSDSCGICSSCIKATKLVHPDIHFSYPIFSSTESKIRTASDVIATFRTAALNTPYMTTPMWQQYLKAENKQLNIPKTEIDSIIKKLKLKAFEGAYKVMIIWLPQYLRKEGNRLLKLIEEPPPNTVFILVANDVNKILNTILSRTQTLQIKPLLEAELSNFLTEKHSLDLERATNVAAIAEGNIAEAIALIDSDTGDYSNDLASWLSGCINGGPEFTLSKSLELAPKGREYHKNLFVYSLRFFRETLKMTSLGIDSEKLNERELLLAQRLSDRLNTDKIVLITELFNKAHYYVERNVNPKLLFMNISIRLQQLFKNNNVSA